MNAGHKEVAESTRWEKAADAGLDSCWTLVKVAENAKD